MVMQGLSVSSKLRYSSDLSFNVLVKCRNVILCEGIARWVIGQSSLSDGEV